jgi:hypothetical protein
MTPPRPLRLSTLFAAGLALALLGGCNVSYSPDEKAQMPATSSGTPAQQAEADAAARGFLALIDAGQYDTTWERAGSALKASSSKLTWTSALKAASLLGHPEQRSLEGFGFTSRVDLAAPVGEYVLVQYKTRSGNVTFTEKVVMQKEQGAWKIVGYFTTKRAEFGTGN